MARDAQLTSAKLSLIGAAIVALAATGGCQAILGIKDVELDTSGTGGAGGEATTTTTTTATTTTTTTGTGGQSQGDYTFSINAASVSAPINGQTVFGIEVVRSAGFELPIEISASGAPDGLVFKGTTLAGGETKGKVTVGATAALAIGTTFDLTLLAKSGEKTQMDTVSVTVTGEPGTLDTTFGTGGVATWSWNTLYGQVKTIRIGGDGKILVGGYTESMIHKAAMSGARLTAAGVLDTSFNMTGVLSESICDCFNAGEEVAGVFRILTGDLLFVGAATRPDKSDRDIVVMRRKDDGTPVELSQGDKGAHYLSVGKLEFVTGTAFTSNDMMLALGDAQIDNIQKMFLARIDAGGKFDTDFGPSGGPGYLTWEKHTPYALAIDSKGRAIIASADTSGILPAHVIDRFDKQAKAAGSVGFDAPPSYSTVGIAALPDDGIAVVGYRDQAIELRRFDANLVPVMPGPTVLDPMPGLDDIPVGIAPLADGRVVVLGNHGGGTPFLARFAADGTVDTTLGGGAGWVDIVIGGAQADSLTVTADGKILVAGSATDLGFKTGVVGRVWN